MDCRQPGSSVHGILQARILAWVALPVSSRSSGPRDLTHMSCVGRQILYHLSQCTWEGRLIIEGASALASQEGRHFISLCLFFWLCQVAVHGVTKSQTRLSDFTFTFHFHALEKEMATHSSVLAWRILGTGEPGGLPSMGSHRVGHK